MKKGMILTFIALMGIIFILPNFLSCGKVTDTGHPIYSITGIIRNKMTNQPIDSAWIDLADSVAPYHTFSDLTGKYNLVFNIGLNNQKIYCGKVGYLIYDTLINISLPQEDFDTVNIFLEPE